jgi:hypothetical protein
MKYLIIFLLTLCLSCKKEKETKKSNLLEKFSDSLFNEAIQNKKIAGAL